jgi:hypothetical protein
VVVDDATDEEEVVPVDGSAEADRRIDPSLIFNFLTGYATLRRSRRRDCGR